jgi:NAD dependent epimerase/dehydratase family enzyme
MLHFALASQASGAFNAVAPAPVTNAQFARLLGRVLQRPAIVPVPGAALRLLFGEMADGTVLASARALPRRLERWGYRFIHTDLEPALRHVLGR